MRDVEGAFLLLILVKPSKNAGYIYPNSIEACAPHEDGVHYWGEVDAGNARRCSCSKVGGYIGPCCEQLIDLVVLYK